MQLGLRCVWADNGATISRCVVNKTVVSRRLHSRCWTRSQDDAILYQKACDPGQPYDKCIQQPE